ncbi:Eukaryotic translation initiation factor 3 subunit H [Venturia nashicola]|uniref:Eukaryotic translation initiation factor 3 subunit H n=1 Tax=Venturia nashicola TaxID=86259 RepID=A0A4Z1P5A5_9PEZI|nr:Eukaryotic translation initiation factor 3 subunit H [Venturia nashicola]
MSIEVGIIGAGIAGLSAAVALRRAGHECEVFEQSHFKNEVGAAITITPNGVLVLKKWGFDFEKAKAIEGTQMRLLNYATLEKVVDDPWTDFEECYGNKSYLFHRVDLHSALREMAEAPESEWMPGKPVRIRLGSPAAQLDVEQGLITVQDGTQFKKDFLVIADGSKFCSAITGKDQPLVPFGRSVFRMLIPFEKVKMAPEVKLFTLNGRDPYDTLWKGRAVIIGDAAHPMAPTHAQAGVLALEEAAALELLFEGVSDLQTIQTHLKAYSDHMRPLCARAQILSSYPVHENAEAMQKLRHVYQGPIPEVDLSFDRSYKDLFYSHNILDDMRELREKLDLAATSQTPPDLDSGKASTADPPVEGVPMAMRAEIAPSSEVKLCEISTTMAVDLTSAAEPELSAVPRPSPDDLDVPIESGDGNVSHSLVELAVQILSAAKVLQGSLTRCGAPKPSLLDPNGPKALPLSPEIQTSKLLLQQSLLDLNLLVTGPTEFFMANGLQWNYDKACVDVLNRLNFWDAVPIDGSATYAEVARKVNIPESAVRRVLRHTFSLRVFAEYPFGSEHVVHTNFSSFPVRQPNVRGWIAHHAEEGGPSAVNLAPALAKWGEGSLPGQTAAGYTFFPGDDRKSLWDWLAVDGESEGKRGYREKRFGDAMAFAADSPGMGMKAGLAAFDWEQLGEATMVDLGGSAGHVCFHLAAAHPGLTCIVQDLAGLEDKFNAARPAELSTRVSFLTHDFFTKQPIQGAEVYFLRKILHDWSDDYAIKILQQITPVMKPGSRILIAEAVAPPTGGHDGVAAEISAPSTVNRIVTALDMHMMTTLGGRERSAVDFATLVKQADERLVLRGIHQSVGNAYAVIEVVLEK